MATNTLKILREINDYTQEFLAEDVLNISQTTYARLEQNPSKINAEQAQKLSDLYKVSIANLLSEASPVITFKDSIKENPNSANGYIQNNNIQKSTDDKLVNAIVKQNEILIRQNSELMKLVKVLGGKVNQVSK